jgi:hypothetical protein
MLELLSKTESSQTKKMNQWKNFNHPHYVQTIPLVSEDYFLVQEPQQTGKLLGHR